jgi:hypothetical protein
MTILFHKKVGDRSPIPLGYAPEYERNDLVFSLPLRKTVDLVKSDQTNSSPVGLQHLGPLVVLKCLG